MKIYVVRSYKIGATGKDDETFAATADEKYPCDCCGRKIKNVDVMSNGMRVGSECSGYMSIPVFRHGRSNKKADAIIAAGGYE